MGTEMLSNAEIVEYYKEDIIKLLTYLPWLETKTGQKTSQIYTADGIDTNSIPFPVYDSTLLSFIKAADTTRFMNRNYIYVYRRSWLKNSRDELRLIEGATIRDMDRLGGILSHYVLGGKRKAALWSQGVSNGVYVALLRKMKELLEYWDREGMK